MAQSSLSLCQAHPYTTGLAHIYIYIIIVIYEHKLDLNKNHAWYSNVLTAISGRTWIPRMDPNGYCWSPGTPGTPGSPGLKRHPRRIRIGWLEAIFPIFIGAGGGRSRWKLACLLRRFGGSEISQAVLDGSFSITWEIPWECPYNP